jgi:Protein of unknown function (DUF3568)
MPALARALLLSAAVAASAALSGCLAAAAGVAVGFGVYAYERGELWAYVPASLDETHEATLTTFEELGLPLRGWSQDAFGAQLRASQVQGGDVIVDLAKESPRVTEVGIRIGSFGDERKARCILRKINEHL